MNGKTYIDEKGYRRFKDSGRLVHRWVAEKKLGGKIGRGRVVHHKDGNKLNNTSWNLWVMNRSAHSSLHARDRYKRRKGFGESIMRFLKMLFDR
ncbi:MAG TPA: HNH endonuclease, partial [Firmicutes bacterium]|nr:HNH endonuclease [Bacillota bacterium]